MSEVKFTKGEWIIYDGDLRYCKGKVCIIEPDDMPTVIADLNDYFGKDAREANAHLVAASPAMYAMLQELLDGGSLHRMDAKAISDLLAKARGE